MTIFDLYTEQGSTYTQTFTLGEDLTGYTVACSATSSVGSTYAGLATLDDEATGRIKIDIAKHITADMSVGVGHYDVELTAPDTTVSKPLKGRLYIDGEVTV